MQRNHPFWVCRNLHTWSRYATWNHSDYVYTHLTPWGHLQFFLDLNKIKHYIRKKSASASRILFTSERQLKKDLFQYLCLLWVWAQLMFCCFSLEAKRLGPQLLFCWCLVKLFFLLVHQYRVWVVYNRFENHSDITATVVRQTHIWPIYLVCFFYVLNYVNHLFYV